MKKVTAFAFASICLLSLSACNSGSKDKAFKPQFDKETSCSLMVRGHYENFEALTEEFREFNEYYPKVKLTYEYDKNHKKNILEALKGDTPPDIFSPIHP